MRAVRIRGVGGSDVLHIEETASPIPVEGEVLVRVVAAGLNRADCLQRRGLYPAPAGVASDIPGLEFAGEVVAVGGGVFDVRVGERVMGIVSGAAMAEYVTTSARQVLRIPDCLSYEEAAAVPEAFVTAYDALVRQGGAQAGHTVLLHAVGSGVGTAALALAHRAGSRVVGTSRTESKLVAAQTVAPFEGILVERGESFYERYMAVGLPSADVILDAVGAAYAADNLRAVSVRGTIVTYGLLGGSAASIDLKMMLGKRVTWKGTVLRSRPVAEKDALAEEFTAAVLPDFAKGALRPIVSAVMPMTEVRRAHDLMESDELFGKIVLTW